ncbi:MAG TPA: hypothetical protein PLZ51_16940, partial [Aggregatilineales bacterium]|nr:hypothetical protein [Aggregatilineales bacterium]
QLLGRPIPDAPLLDATARKLRLQVTLNALFKRQTTPIVLILDDLQWSNNLDTLKGVHGLLETAPILIIGTFRDDERPTLPDELGIKNIIHLSRFETDEVMALSTAMLGEGGKKANVVALLTQETEGNIFFLIEVVRALAEEVGNLSQIGLKTLPDHVFTGGILTIVNRRLSKLPPALAIITQMSAIIGREIDLSLLAHHYEKDFLDEWLIASADAMIIEIKDNRWRFTHDKLREGALRSITPHSLRTKLHRKVARAIEAVYPDNADYHRALLEHWHMAGNLKKEIAYLEAVVKYDLNITGAHQRVHGILDRTLTVLSKEDRSRMSLLNLRAS